MAELTWENWPAGVSHTIWVDVYSRSEMSTLRLHVRAAMKGWWDPCSVQIEPTETEATARDQQGYPAFERVFKLSSSHERMPPTRPISPDHYDPKKRVVLATVQVVAVDNDTNNPLRAGSGSLIDPLGYVLTNLHVVLDDEMDISCINEVRCRIGVGLPDAADPYNKPPHYWYHASVVGIDPAIDLAVLKLDSTWEGDTFPPFVNFPTAQLGNSNELEPGDGLIIIGFPGVGGDTVTITRGQVSGFAEGLIKTRCQHIAGQ